MILYHGSPANNIKYFLIQDKNSTNNEGEGFYLTDLEDVAKQYGKNIYSFQVDNKYILDLTTKKGIDLFFEMLLINPIINFDNTKFDFINILKENIIEGCISITKIVKEIELHIESKEDVFYYVVRQHEKPNNKYGCGNDLYFFLRCNLKYIFHNYIIKYNSLDKKYTSRFYEFVVKDSNLFNYLKKL